MTDTLQPSFASEEYVRRWLTGADQDSPGLAHVHERTPEAHKREKCRGQKHRKHSHHGHEQSRKREPHLRIPSRAIPPQRDVGRSISIQKDQAEPEPNDAKNYPPKRQEHNHGRSGCPISSPSISQLAVLQSPRPGKSDEQDPSFRYARRPRHKTRLDKYEYKGHEEEGKQSRRKPGHNRRSLRKKSGAMLAQDFKAPNVKSDRLTLKQNQIPGIFSKGKASVPVPRRGIPDLTFSEMTFLNKKRDLDDARFRGIYDQGRPENRQNAAGHAISEYFATAANASSGSRQQSVSTSRNSETESSPAKILGHLPQNEASGKDRDVRTRLLQSHQNIQLSHKWNADHTIPKADHYEPVCGPTQAESHVSWPLSPEREAPHWIDLDCTAGAPKNINQAAHGVAATVHPKSSVSTSARTPRQGQRDYQLRTAAIRYYYSLEDLKHLAATIARNQPLREETRSYDNRQHHQSTSESCIGLTQPQDHTDYVAGIHDPGQPSSLIRESACQPSRTQGALKTNADVSEIVKDMPISLDHTPYQMQHSSVRMALPLRTDKEGRGVFNSVNSHSETVTPTISFPGYQLWQHRQPTPDIGLLQAHDHHYYQSEDHDAVVEADSAKCNQYLGTVASETMGTGQRDAEGLDAFDTALLRSTENLQDRSQGGAIQPDDVHYLEVDQSSPSCYEIALGYDGAEYASRAPDTESVLDISSRLGHPRRSDMGQTRRPHLLRPSEDPTALAPEPFTGFSRPWILY